MTVDRRRWMHSFSPMPGMPVSSVARLTSHPGFLLSQKKELLELFGVETPNAYRVLSLDGQEMFRATEREGGFLKEAKKRIHVEVE